MLAPRKSLGQNFLRDENIARNIVESLRLEPGDAVVEIGPGQGVLTRHLCAVARDVTAIEIDERAIEVSLLDLARDLGRRLRVVGNIPYTITSSILFWLFESRSAVNDATLMVQREVARRFVARPRTKEYGILSVFVQYYTEAELIMNVSRNCFSPRPNVDSAVVRLAFRRELFNANEQQFKAIVRGTFGKRRKTLRNGLRSMGFSDEHLETVVFDLSRRPESLSLDEFLALAKMLAPFDDDIRTES
jgi:16S rRNA (adenine1518-N6/adenine1519-N6)-dimethyltransferase